MWRKLKEAWKQGEPLGNRCHHAWKTLKEAQPQQAWALWQGAYVPAVCSGRRRNSGPWALFLFPSPFLAHFSFVLFCCRLETLVNSLKSFRDIQDSHRIQGYNLSLFQKKKKILLYYLERRNIISYCFSRGLVFLGRLIKRITLWRHLGLRESGSREPKLLPGTIYECKSWSLERSFFLTFFLDYVKRRHWEILWPVRESLHLVALKRGVTAREPRSVCGEGEVRHTTSSNSGWLGKCSGLNFKKLLEMNNLTQTHVHAHVYWKAKI